MSRKTKILGNIFIATPSVAFLSTFLTLFVVGPDRGGIIVFFIIILAGIVFWISMNGAFESLMDDYAEMPIILAEQNDEEKDEEIDEKIDGEDFVRGLA